MATTARLWISGELVAAAKMNTLRSDLQDLDSRAAGGGRLILDTLFAKTRWPIYDTAEVGGVTFTPTPVDGDDLTAAATEHYTVPNSGVYRTAVHSITIVNTSSTNRLVQVHLIESGGSRGVSSSLFYDTVTAGEAIELVLNAQIALRNNRRLQAAMRSSRLPAVKTLAQFDFTFQPSLKREQIESLHELGFASHAPARFAPELSQARQDRPRPFGRTSGPRRLSGAVFG